MLFELTHVTEYRYAHPAAEAYGEARLTPPNTPAQTIQEHRIIINPEVRIANYVDYYKNHVSFYTLPFRHNKLIITNKATVITRPVHYPKESLEISVQEARQIFYSALPDIYEFLQPTDSVATGRDAVQWGKKYLRAGTSLQEGITALNQAIYSEFAYKPGTTTNFTPLGDIWKHRRGVCQDFAHIMLSVLRSAGLPCRYVCGYIETDPPPKTPGTSSRRLIGSVATHAWVEVLLPGMHWAALDPTNNQWCGERHITVSYGLDASDATPLRGTFKGAGESKMRISVLMKRRTEKQPIKK